jgi:hypothetical protein
MNDFLTRSSEIYSPKSKNRPKAVWLAKKMGSDTNESRHQGQSLERGDKLVLWQHMGHSVFLKKGMDTWSSPV